ncbi:cold-shock protein [Chloroflexota bacterium]
MNKGPIKKLMDNGFGFIQTEEGKDLFFHRNEIEGVEFSSLRAGQEVEFEMGQDSKGRPQAVKVRLVETQLDDDSGDDQGGDDQVGVEGES